MAAIQHEVVILGAGLAGLSLARQLLTSTGKRVLLIEKRSEVPSTRQKVGEATVQVGAYYFAKVLDLEEHLFSEHFVKYNLRFYWATPGRENKTYEDYSQSYIRDLSNIATFQLDRNKIEEELLRLNLECDRFEFQPGIANLDVTIGEADKPHGISYEVGGQRVELQADWLVDASGRAKFLARKLGLTKPSPIHHGATFFWVNGLVNVERLTGLSSVQGFAHPSRQKLGHLPAWLATNHFMGEGYWFWTIPLQGKTSLGLVYDHSKVHADDVSSPEKVIAWIAKRFPLFAQDLATREIVDQGLYRDFSYDCSQTISADKWALAGESGRFTDPLYSPGSDLIALYNTMITDAILTEEQSSLAVKARLYELLMWAFYEAYVPSYSVSYDVLGDQECFAMKYSWELMVYFTFYVFPFINHVFTNAAFVVPFLDLFAKLGVINNSIQPFIAGYYRWKKGRLTTQQEPVLFDFTSFEPLKKSQELFYQVGLTPRECIRGLERQMANVEKMARFIAAYIYSAVLEDDSILLAKNLAETIDIETLEFDPEKMKQTSSVLNTTKESKLTKAGTDFITEFRRPKQQTS
ncbi:MAG: NAD(P)-binding protein [Acidobacteriia bacterium]|nr:NAD(P)-binding protein [Terriglobia bacterium]